MKREDQGFERLRATPAPGVRGAGADPACCATSLALGDLLGASVGAEVVGALLDLPHAPPLPEEPGLEQARLLRPQVARLMAVPTGPALVLALEALMATDLSEREHADVVAAWERLRNHCAGAQLTSLSTWQQDRAARVAREERAGRPDPWSARGGAASIGDEVAPRPGVAPATATRRVRLATRAEAHFPAALDALTEGQLGCAHLEALAAVATDVSESVRQRLEAAAIRSAPHRTAAQLRQDLAELAARLDPDHAARAAAAGVESRDVWLRPSPTPGCSRLVADLPTADATAAMIALAATVKAARAAGDDRPVGQLRADALVGAVTGLVRDLL